MTEVEKAGKRRCGIWLRMACAILTKRARPRERNEAIGVWKSTMLGPSCMKSMLANASTETLKTMPKKMRSGSAFLSTDGARPIFGTSIACKRGRTVT